MPRSSGYSGLIMVRKMPVKSEFKAGLRHATTGKLSVNPAENEYLFRIREEQGSERRGMGSAFHQLCPRYSGILSPTAPTIRLWETFTFFFFFLLKCQISSNMQNLCLYKCYQQRLRPVCAWSTQCLYYLHTACVETM